jgi:hypothetical protein
MYLIDEKYLADYTSVSINKNAKDIKVAFQAVTIIHLKPLLGIALYGLLESFIEGIAELSDKQFELLDMVKYYMALKVEKEMLFNIVNISNKGATEEDRAANLETVTTLRQLAESKAASVKKNILTFLADNKDDFPEYFPKLDAQDYTGGIIFEPKKIIYFY